MKPERIAEIAMEVSDSVEWDEWEQWAELSLVEFATKLIAAINAERGKDAVAVVGEETRQHDYMSIKTGRLSIWSLKPMTESGLKVGDKLFLHPHDEKE